jgi:hypothetical protein
VISFLTTMPTGTSPEVLTFNMAELADSSRTEPLGWMWLEVQDSRGILSRHYG